ncbi:MAG: FtsX-like permease family protein, partial [bacterium]|nr:FtsX-like permease family protein [bacterium]
IGNTIIPEKELDQYGFKLQNICDINLGKNLRNSTPGTKSSIDVFFIPFLAAMIVFLVCFNYIILSIARSLKRSKEIGLRKVIGSKRSQIIKLFLSEAFVITLLALITACIFIIWLIPVFNNLDAIENSKQQINLEMMKDPGIYIDFILVAIVISLLAGLYPALYLSSIRPLNALQGVSKIIGFTHLLTRKILMGIQFGVSLLSIIIILYYNQLSDFWMNYDRGISADNIVNVYLGDMNYETVRNEISKNSMFTRVSFSSEAPLYGQTSYTSFRMENMAESLRAFYFNIDNEFIDNFKLKLLAGRNFSKDYLTDAGDAVIVNEKTIQALGYDSPDMVIGKVLTLRDDSEVTVIGVVKDYTYRTFFEKEIGPMVIISKPDGFLCANIRYLPEKEDEIKATLPEIWKKFTEAYPVGYSFSNDELEEYEDNISGGLIISSWAGGFVILIALFGLLGMTAYTTELRVKEIGIRKVLGATVRGSVYLLSKGYVKLIILTGAITLPTGYILTALMFQFFPIKPGLSLLVPPAALLFILLLAFITVGSQTIKAALANPVNTLRED